MEDPAPTTLKQFKASDWAVLATIAVFALLAVLHMLFGLKKVLGILVHPTTAAWVQAIGAIAAIGIAIWVANGADRSARANARITAKHFIRMAQAAIGGLHVVSDIYSEEADVQKVRFLAEVREVHHIGQAVSIALLDPKLCDLVLDARILVARCHDLGSDIRARRPPHHDDEPFPKDRSGYSIGNALLKASWRDIQEIHTKASAL